MDATGRIGCSTDDDFSQILRHKKSKRHRGKKKVMRRTEMSTEEEQRGISILTPAEYAKLTIEMPMEELEMSTEEQWRLPFLTPAGYAELALEIQNACEDEEDASYEFVKSLGCKRFLAYIPCGSPHDAPGDYVPADQMEVGDYCHVSFIAKPINTTTDHDDDQVVIFAELVDYGYNIFRVHDWGIFLRNSPRDYYKGCAFCPREEDYPHPTVSRAIGQLEYDHIHSIATSQSDLAASFKELVLSLRHKTYKLPSNVILNYTLPDPSVFSPELSDDEFAMLALLGINDKEGAEFELVKTLGRRRQTWFIGTYKDWCHVCFIAKPKNDDDSQVHFFAELCDPGVQKFSVSTYSRVDPSDAGTTKKGCGICPENENFLHPAIVSYNFGDLLPFCCGGCISSSDDEDDHNGCVG